VWGGCSLLEALREDGITGLGGRSLTPTSCGVPAGASCAPREHPKRMEGATGHPRLWGKYDELGGIVTWTERTDET